MAYIKKEFEEFNFKRGKDKPCPNNSDNITYDESEAKGSLLIDLNMIEYLIPTKEDINKKYIESLERMNKFLLEDNAENAPSIVKLITEINKMLNTAVESRDLLAQRSKKILRYVDYLENRKKYDSWKKDSEESKDTQEVL